MTFDYPQIQQVPFRNLRFYETPNGKFYPSVTTILGETMPEEKAVALKKWQQALGKAKTDKIVRDAADNGTATHTLIERFLHKEELIRPGDNFSPNTIAGFNALKLKLKKIDEVWGMEVSLYSDLMEMAGRCDCVGVYNGKPSIIDFKTSIKLKGDKAVEDYRLQITAYAIMHNELFGTEIEDGVILMTAAGGFPQEFRFDITKYVEPLVARVDQFYHTLYSGI